MPVEIRDILERFRFSFKTVNAKHMWDTLVCHVMSTFGSPTQMQDKKIFRCTRAVCYVSVDLNAFVNLVHTLKYIPFPETINKITLCYTVAIICLNLIY